MTIFNTCLNLHSKITPFHVRLKIMMRKFKKFYKKDNRTFKIFLFYLPFKFCTLIYTHTKVKDLSF
jgi:hypothetical protein